MALGFDCRILCVRVKTVYAKTAFKNRLEKIRIIRLVAAIVSFPVAMLKQLKERFPSHALNQSRHEPVTQN